MSVEFLKQARRARGSGSVLVVILLLVVLFSTIILAYFSRARIERQISTSSAGVSRADFLARSAMETIKGDLLNEVRAGSTILSTTNGEVFLPLTNRFMAPQRVGANGVTNIVKASTHAAPMWYATNGLAFTTNGPTRSASGNSTTNSARDGRMIAADRWLVPQMTGANEISAMPAPDWVIVTRQGPVTADRLPPLSKLSDKALSNPDYAIGRYAFIIYDEGGLLDVTVAGYPSTGSDLTPAQVGRKGLLALADLKQIPNGSDKLTQSQVDGLVAWRNAATKGAFFNHLTTGGTTNGFLRTEPGDQTFVTRQDLIRYARLNQFEGALPYLATFTRARTAPSWFPRYNASEIGGANGPGNVFAYKNNAEAATSSNRKLPALLDADGGPLLKTRFPLSRIALLRNASAAPAAILDNFGLSKSGVKWTYNHGRADHILTLEEVKAANRSPDFFELLKAGILSGSLGHRISGTYSDLAFRPTDSQAQDDHIIQIGANILDQYDAGNTPTLITFNGRDFSGIENLPYLMRILSYVYEETTDVVSTWWQPEVWRPYQDLSAVAAGDRDSVPSAVRIQATGRTATEWSDGHQMLHGVSVDFDANPGLGQIEFPVSSISRSAPVALLSTTPGLTSPSAANLKPWTGNPVAGFFTGNVAYSADPQPDPVTEEVPPIWVYPFIERSVSIQLQTQQEDGSWHPYSGMANLRESHAIGIGGSARNGVPDIRPAGRRNLPYLFLGRSDPRTERFGASVGDTGLSSYEPGRSLRPDSTAGYTYFDKIPSGISTVSEPPLGLLSDNRSNSAVRYADPDGVVRPAAGAYSSGGESDRAGYPLSNVDASRPLLLNRSFQSVGELGYAFRDLPWKELDFFTQESADAGLLDLFSVYEEPEVVAGRISLNSARPEVLAAMLAGASRRETQLGVDLTSDAPAIGAAIRDHLANHGALFNRSELVTECSGSLTNAFASNDVKRNKTQREAVVRALADVSDTRTWNLMIDVIAQAGRYAPNAASLNDFIVEGEKRYWLHVAIDRYTGEVIGQQWEAVSE